MGTEEKQGKAPISRRYFLQHSALAMAAGPVLSAATLAQARRAAAQTPPSEKVRVGLIGCGGIATADLSTFFLNPEVDCPVICDIDDAMLAIERDNPCLLYTSPSPRDRTRPRMPSSA